MPILARANTALSHLDLELVLRPRFKILAETDAKLKPDTAAPARIVHLGRGVTLDRRGRVLVRGAPLALAEGGEGRAVLHEVGTGRVVLEL